MRKWFSGSIREEMYRDNDHFEKSYDFGIKGMRAEINTSSFSYPTGAAHQINPIGPQKKGNWLMWFT